MLLAGLGLVCIEKNCDQGIENAALSLWPQAAFSRPWSQLFLLQTSQLANKIIIIEIIRQLKFASFNFKIFLGMAVEMHGQAKKQLCFGFSLLYYFSFLLHSGQCLLHLAHEQNLFILKVIIYEL